MLTNADIQNFLNERLEKDAQREGSELVTLDKVNITKLTNQYVGGNVEGTSVSIRFSPEKVYINKDCSCLTKSCRHIAALLQYVHGQRNKGYNNKAGYWRRIISEMDSDDKSDFIMSTVRRNKGVAYDLRAFVLRQEGVFAVQRSQEILDELKAPIVRSTKTPTAPQVRLYIQLTKTVIKSAESLLDQGYVYQSITILQLFLSNLYYLHYRLHRNNTSVYNHLEQLEEMIIAWLPLLRAPEAQYDIFESWIALTSKSYFVPISTASIESFIDVLPSIEMKQDALTHIENMLVKSNVEDLGHWSLIWLNTMIRHAHLNSQITYDELDPNKKEYFWRKLTEIESLPPSLVQLFLDIQPHLTPRHRRRSLEILIKNGFTDSTVQMMEQFPDLLFLPGYEEVANEILEEETNYQRLAPTALSSVITYSGNKEKIFNHITNSNNLQVTTQLLHGLGKSDIHDVQDLLIQQIESYLSNHIGDQSRKLINELFGILKEKGNTALLKDVKRKLKDLYGYRNDVHHVLSTN